MPRHVGLILDGNRRHARTRQITDPAEIYGPGADKLNEVLGWCADLGIKIVTLRVLSADNLKRSPLETSVILAVIERKMRQLVKDAQIHDRKIELAAEYDDSITQSAAPGQTAS